MLIIYIENKTENIPLNILLNLQKKIIIQKNIHTLFKYKKYICKKKEHKLILHLKTPHIKNLIKLNYVTESNYFFIKSKK